MGWAHPCWKAWGKAAGKDRGKELRDYICICKCELSGGKKVEVGQDYQHSKLVLSDVLFQQSSPSPKYHKFHK